MFLDKKLKRWVEAGLITEAASLEISNFEKTGSKSEVLFGILAVGALSIAVGIISIIAANWYSIPKFVKLSSNIFWLISLSFGIFRFDCTGHKVLKEVLLLILFGSILGSIALIGQIYHLESHAFKSISLWLAIGTPLMLFSQTKYGAHAWAIVLTIWAFLGYNYFFPSLYSQNRIDINFGYIPFILIYATLFIKSLSLKNSHLRQATFKYSALVFVATTMLLGTFRWYEDYSYPLNQHSVIVLLLSLPICWFLSKTYSTLAGLIFFLATAYLEGPNLFPHKNLDLWAALYFLILWCLVAYLGIKLSRRRMFEIACGVISLRIIFVYFEVFGSLMQTGIGLVTSGMFILLVGYVWHKKKEVIWGLGRQ